MRLQQQYAALAQQQQGLAQQQGQQPSSPMAASSCDSEGAAAHLQSSSFSGSDDELAFSPEHLHRCRPPLCLQPGYPAFVAENLVWILRVIPIKVPDNRPACLVLVMPWNAAFLHFCHCVLSTLCAAQKSSDQFPLSPHRVALAAGALSTGRSKAVMLVCFGLAGRCQRRRRPMPVQRFMPVRP